MRVPLRSAVIALIAVAISCGTGSEPLNVVIIAVDTLRPDHLGCYGYERNTSPAIDNLAAEGVLLENTISQSPWTLPSFSTVFTSLYPSQHGAMSAVSRMRETFPTLAAILKEHGYATGAVVNATVLRPEYGVNRGFDYYDPPPSMGRRADGVTADVLEWIQRHNDRPFLMFAHYFDPHEPYAPLPPYDALFDAGYNGRIGNAFVLHDYFPNVVGMNFDDLRSLDEMDWDHIRALYDGEIAYTDKAIADLLSGLSDLGIRDNTLVVFLSDHGEEFFEHEGFGHGHTLFGEVIRVPLIFSLPDRLPEGMRVSRQVRLIDVMPTILSLLGISTDAHLEGIDLMPALTGNGETAPSRGALFPPGAAYSEGLLQGSERKGITAQPWKMIYDLRTRNEMLFNLEQDPAEEENLVVHKPEALALLEGMMFKSLFEMSDTWYIEMVGTAQEHTLDLKITSERGPAIGNIPLFKFFDTSGRTLDVGQVLTSAEGHMVAVKGIQLEEPLTLAFIAEGPGAIPVNLDLRLDGKPAIENTYFGEKLKAPAQMPFALKSRPNTAQLRTGPSSRPEPPYFLIWHYESVYKGKTTTQLDEKIKGELRALGYIQ
ncbi:MAG: sulfatase [Candidatus Eisenbacteria bacterium]